MLPAERVSNCVPRYFKQFEAERIEVMEIGNMLTKIEEGSSRVLATIGNYVLKGARHPLSHLECPQYFHKFSDPNIIRVKMITHRGGGINIVDFNNQFNPIGVKSECFLDNCFNETK